MVKNLKLLIISFVLIQSNLYAAELRNSKVEVANYSSSQTLTRIEQFMPKGNQYRDSDPITSAHEQLHGLCSILRLQNGLSNESRLTTIYIPQTNYYYIIKAEGTTLKNTARYIPYNLRGSAYNLYMIQQSGDWNNQPWYLIEEWCCYYVGSCVRAELKIESRGETVEHMIELMTYSLYMLKTSKSNPELEKFIVDQIYRSAEIYHKNVDIGGVDGATRYLDKIKKEKIYGNFLNLLGKYPRDK